MNRETIETLDPRPAQALVPVLTGQFRPGEEPSQGFVPGTGQLARKAFGWALVLLVLSGAAIILNLWLTGGGVSAVKDPATLFTSIGRITGLFGSYLLLIQILLLARLPFVQWVVPFDRLTLIHRLNGKICLYLILAHVLFITIGYAGIDRVSIPSEVRSLLTLYPGMVTAVIGTLLISLVVVTSIVIVRRRLRYETWFLVHLLAYLGIFLSWGHQVPTGDEFATNPVAAAFWTGLYVVTLQLVLLFRVLVPAIRALWHGLRVEAVIPEGPDTVSIRITGRNLVWLNARSGQYFQWRFLDRRRWFESHPFSLSAAPDGRSFRITVKSLGDFTSNLPDVKPGTRVIADGPFGDVTTRAQDRNRVALIAGGIGITPIRALLEDLRGDIVMVYRVVRETDVIFRRELDELAHSRGITLHYVLGDHRDEKNAHLMTPQHLRELIPGLKSREVFLCGPPAMVESIERSLNHAGVRRKNVHVEKFAL